MNENELKKTDFLKRNYIFVLFTIFAVLNFLTLVYGDYVYFLYVKKMLSDGWEFTSWIDFIPNFLLCFLSLIPVVAAIFISFNVEKTENKNKLKIMKVFVLCYVFTDLGLSVISLLNNIFQINLYAYLPHFLVNISGIFYTHNWPYGIFHLIQCFHEPQIPDSYIPDTILYEAYYIIFWI